MTPARLLRVAHAVGRLTAGAAVLLGLCPQGARGQDAGTREPSLPGLVLNGPTSPWAAALLPRVVAEGDARTFQMIEVRRPPVVPVTSPLHYRVEAWFSTTVLGPHEGLLPAGDTLHPLLFSIGIPAGAPAGARVTARIRFEGEGRERSLVADLPIETRVHRRHALGLAAPVALQVTRPGQRLVVSYRVSNQGNGVDTAWSSVTVPPGWTVVAASVTPAVLESGAASNRTAEIDIPSGATAGPTSVQVAVRSSADSTGTPSGRVTLQVEVLDPRLSVGARTLGLRLGVASAASTVADSVPGGVLLRPASGSHAPVAYLVAVDGPITDALRLSGRWTHTPAGLNASRVNALYREGYTDMPAYLDLSGAGLSASLGNASALFPDIAGGSAYARGASASYRTDVLHWTALYGTQIRNPGDSLSSPATMGGATMGMIVHGWDLGATAVQLHEQSSKVRDLRAAGAVIRTPSVFGLQGEVGAATRQYLTGSGVGTSMELDRHGPHDDLLVRHTETPGGSGAFAPALRQTAIIGSRTLGDRLAVMGSFWSSLDSTQTYQNLRSTGWSVGPQLQLARTTDLRLDIRRSAYDASGGIDAFGSGTTSGMATLTSSLGAVYGSLALGEEADIRRSQLGSTSETILSGQRGTWVARTGLGSTRGQAEMELSGIYAVRGSSTGAPPSLVTLRVDRFQPVLGHPEWTLHADVQAANWQGEGPLSVHSYIGTSLVLPSDIEVAIDAEHAPLLGAGNAAGWSVGVRVERTFGLPTFTARGLGLSGIVYEDRNGNGVRDNGEPGVENVMVRRGTETAMTDRLGRYRFVTSSNALPTVDVRSLPAGWIARSATRLGAAIVPGVGGSAVGAPALLRDGSTVNLAVRRTASVHLHVMIDAGGDSIVASQDMRQITATLTDSVAESWSAPLNARGDVPFDGLPAGRYLVELDVSHLNVPLRLRSAPLYTVIDTRDSTVPIVLIPRATKVFAAAGVGRILNDLTSLPLVTGSVPLPVTSSRLPGPPPLHLTRTGHLAVAHDVRVDLGDRVLRGTPAKRRTLELVDDTVAQARLAARRAQRDSVRQRVRQRGRMAAAAASTPSLSAALTPPVVAPKRDSGDMRRLRPRYRHSPPVPPAAPATEITAPSAGTVLGGTACYVPRARHAAVRAVHGPVVPEAGMLDRLGLTGWLRRLRGDTATNTASRRAGAADPDATVITTTTTTTTTTVVAGHGKTVHTVTMPAAPAVPACPSPAPVP